MKIKELENLLSISRSNVRFYEKQGLFSPERKDNNYREYTEHDIEVLKKIIVFRKLGFSVEEIKLIQNNELPFTEAISVVSAVSTVKSVTAFPLKVNSTVLVSASIISAFTVSVRTSPPNKILGLPTLIVNCFVISSFTMLITTSPSSAPSF